MLPMTKCPYCGKKIKPSDKICPHCGKLLMGIKS